MTRPEEDLSPDDPVRVERSAGVRTLTPGGMPLLVADLPDTVSGSAVRVALRGAGLRTLAGFIGVDFPKGASVGILLEGEEVRLVDDQETTLLRLGRTGLSGAWLDAALRMKGTMIAVTTALDVEQLDDPAALGAALEVESRDGRVDGAIIGVSDRRPRLPLLF
jgi:hypothetical protein